MAPRPKAPACSWRAATAHEADAAGEQDLRDIRQRLAAVAGIPTPELIVVDDAYPTAFAFGGGPFRGRIMISTGLSALLTRNEMTAVLAHEISHIKRRHSLLMILTNALAAAFVLIGGLIALVGYSLRRQGGIFLAALGIAAAFAALVCRDAIARHCEFEADRLGALLCGHPEWLVSALCKVSALHTSQDGRIVSQRRRRRRYPGRHSGQAARSPAEAVSTAPLCRLA
jgi:heat shock protein HtpX